MQKQKREEIDEWIKTLNQPEKENKTKNMEKKENIQKTEETFIY